MKIASIVGARPQFIKLAPIDREINSGPHTHIIIHTGQHYDYEMSKAFFDQLAISEPDYNLEIGSGAHAWQTGQMLIKIGAVLEEVRPDLVLVYGDTNSTIAGALAAVKLHIAAAHVESGYRSGDIAMPEEVNRVATDRICQILFAPTAGAVSKLISEGTPEKNVFFVGNIMAESLLSNLERINESQILNELGIEPKAYAVLTAHRPENTNDPQRLSAIIEGIIAADFPTVFPVHPRTIAFLEKYGLEAKIKAGKIRLIEPLKYLDFIKLQADARLILTDSGGMQEEALLLDVPCLTLRYNTERWLTLELGANQLVGAEKELITAGILRLVKAGNHVEFSKPKFWDTGVARRIIAAAEDNPELLSIKPQAGNL